ncbi:MAG: DNA repair protein RadC [Acidobacteriota bacterium]
MTSSPDESPRERLLRRGAASLSDSELVAVLLSRGARTQELAGRLVGDAGGLTRLSASDVTDLRRRGVSDPRAANLLAAFEVSCRLARAQVPRQPLTHPETVVRYLSMRYTLPDQEVMGALFLDARNQLMSEVDIFRGTLTRMCVEPRAILRQALMHSASSLVLFHSHPSGDPSPSQEDVAFTKRMSKAGSLVGIRLLDHLILGAQGTWVSLLRRGIC